MNRNDVNRKTWYLLILMPIIYLAVSVLVVFLVKNNGAYLQVQILCIIYSVEIMYTIL